MRSYTEAMSTNRPSRTTQITAIAATLALIVATFVIALASFAAGAYPHRSVEEPATASASQAAQSSDDLIDGSIGRGADSRVCTTSPSSPRCRLEGGSDLTIPREAPALRPADDSPSTVLLNSEWDETGPADMPGRAPGRGGWVGEEGPSRA